MVSRIGYLGIRCALLECVPRNIGPVRLWRVIIFGVHSGFIIALHYCWYLFPSGGVFSQDQSVMTRIGTGGIAVFLCRV
jgi:hypothetical protein